MLGITSTIKSYVKRGFSRYITDGLKLYMPFTKKSGTVQFVGEGSTSFDGTNDYVSVADSNDLSFGDGSTDSAFSISAWVNMTDASGFWIVEKGVQETAGEYLLGCNNSDHLDFYLYDESSNAYEYIYVNASIMTPLEGQWIHIAATYNGVGGTSANAGQEIYINGVLQTVTRSDSGSYVAMENLGAELKIGVQGTTYGEGSIKNVAIWNRALTATEIQNVMYKTYAEVSGRLASGLVSWWGLDVDYTDSHGDNDGTNSGSTLDTDLYGGDTPVKPRAIDNAPTVQSDAIGSGSASFDGTDDYIDLGADSSFEITSAITCSAWVNCETIPITTGLVICKDDDSGDKAFNISLQSSAINWRIYDGGTAYTATYSTGIVDNTWHHLCGTYDGSNLKLYVDGVLQATQAHSGDIDAESGEKVFIGQRGDGARFFDGNICQVGVWDAALDQEQIQSIMEKTYEELTASEKTNLVSYWALDEAEGATSGYSSAYSGEIAFDKVDETLGSEVNTTANATSPTNEANATTGWTTVGTSGWVVASSDDKYNGNYSLKGVSEASGDRFDADRFPIDTNTVYKVSYWIKVVNGSASPVRKLQIRAGTSTNYTNFFTSWLYDTEWTNEVFYIYTGGEPWLYISLLEHSAGDDVEFYFDNLSIKPVNGNPGILF